MAEMIQDEKVICVPVSDPIWNSLNDLSDMNPHIKRNRTFKFIKILKTKQLMSGWGDVNEAYEIIKNVQIVLIKLKINQRRLSVLSNKYLVFYKKSNILLRVLLLLNRFVLCDY
jgi:hypothetical protein